MSEITTIAACTTALAVIMSVVFFLTWLKGNRSLRAAWQMVPFILAIPAGILLTFPDILHGRWGIWIGWFILTLVYGIIWIIGATAAGRRAPVATVLILSVTTFVVPYILKDVAFWQGYQMAPRSALFGFFNWMAAREFRRIKDPMLPSVSMLVWTCLTFGTLDVLRTPFSALLPAPLGSGDVALWSIIIFNFMIAMNGLMLGLCLTALGREEKAAENYVMAATDVLTGIGNRLAFNHRLDGLKTEVRSGSVIALAVLDIDNFKVINDEHGHLFGDLVIKAAANVGQNIFGGGNIYRVGGEEFVAVLKAETVQQIFDQLEDFRLTFRGFTLTADTIGRCCTISIGLAQLVPGMSPLAILDAADQQLYRAKNMGRNRTSVGDGIVQTSACSAA